MIVYRNSPSTAFVYLNNNYFCRNYFLDSRDPCVGTAIRVVFNQKLYKKYEHDVSSHVFLAEDTTITSHHNNSSVYISGIVTSNVDLQFHNFTCIENVAVNNGICMIVEFLRYSEILPTSSSLKVHISGVHALYNKYRYRQLDQHGLVPNVNPHLKNPSLFTFINIQLAILDEISLFIDNEVTVISAFNSDVKLKGEVRFENNEVLLSHGILYLTTLSHLIFSENVKVEFINNGVVFNDSALITGFSTTSNTLGTYCAFQFESIDSVLNVAHAFNITFKNNSIANRTGELITITPAYHCVQTYSDRKHLDMGNIYNKIFHSAATMIRSTPIKVCVCTNVTSFTCIGVVENTQSNIYPGTAVTIYIAVTDEGSKIVPAIILAQLKVVNHKSHSELFFSPHTFIKEFYHYNHCAYFSYTINTSSHYLHKFTSAYLLISVLHKQPTLRVNFQIQQCPIGFELQNGRCDCNKFIKAIRKRKSNNEIMCNLRTESNNSYALVRMTNNMWFWLGIGNEITTRVKSLETKHYAPSLVYSGICPLGSCNLPLTY